MRDGAGSGGQIRSCGVDRQPVFVARQPQLGSAYSARQLSSYSVIRADEANTGCF